MTRRQRKIRWVLMGGLALIIVVMLLIARPTIFLLGVSSHDRDALPPVAAGHADDASRMNETAVNEIVHVLEGREAAEVQLAELLQRAAAEQLRVSIAGARHTMGGHTIYPGGVVIDMTTFNHMELDEDNNILRVQAGARWADIIAYLDPLGQSVAIMQSNNSFTVGGSISANCHGWPVGRPPIASTVRSFRLMLANGSILRCSRDENAELFSLALGGYGLFGIILDVELDVAANEKYRIAQHAIGAHEIPEFYRRDVLDRDNAAMAYCRLRVTSERFLEDAILVVFNREAGAQENIPPLSDPSLVAVKRSVFRGSAGSDYGKRLRWNAELALSERMAEQIVSRNALLNDPVDIYQDRSDETVDILHEYFLPPKNFGAFLSVLREIVPKHDADLLNVTVRHVAEDHDTFLRYADQEMFAFVLLFSQERTDEADAKMRALTRELIDAALKLGGRYYLPYRLHATVEQFDAAYPQGCKFFELKRKYDPAELFQNEFYRMYSGARMTSADG